MDPFIACCPSGIWYLAVSLKCGRWEYSISVPNNVNKQVGSLIAWSTQGQSSKTLLWVFPWEPRNYWIKINHHFTMKWETRSTELPEEKTNAYKESFTSAKAPEELASRVVIAHIFYSDHQMLHNQHCITHLPGVSVTSAQRSQLYPSQTMNVFTLGKTRHIA